MRVETRLSLTASAGAPIGFAIFQDAVANALVAGQQQFTTAGDRQIGTLALQILAAVIVTITFKVRAGNTSGATTALNGTTAAARKMGGVMNSWLDVEEVMA